MISVGYVLFAGTKGPDAAAIVSAAGAFGWLIRSDGSDKPMHFFVSDEDTECMVMFIEAPFPDRETVAFGPTSPPYEATVATRSHAIVTAMSEALSAEALELRLLAMLAAVIDASGEQAVGAMTKAAVVVHIAGLVSDMAKLAYVEGRVPAEIAVDVTMAPEPGERMSFLTHGLWPRGREEFFITCPQRGKGALEFLFMMVGWMLRDPDKALPTGDTVGRTAEEKLRVQRVPNPAHPEQQAIRLDLP